MLSIFVLLVLAVLVLGGFWFAGGYNKLTRLKALLDEGWSGIDVQLKRRYDLVPNLVAVVKQYSIHEKEIFEQVARYRAAAINAQSVDQKSQADTQLTGALKTLFAVVENYPDLKANENFLSLQRDLNSIEQEIQLSRRYYNGTARTYNSSRNVFPTNVIASMAGFSPAQYFELTSAGEREAPQVKF
jgi:LemA protein